LILGYPDQGSGLPQSLQANVGIVS